MGVLALFLAIVTYTVDTKSTVKASGDISSEMVATYACSYQKGTITAGNTATLTVSGCQHVNIDSVTLYMRSNKASGAGKLTLTMNDTTQWYIPDAAFNSSKWAGNYSTEFVPITKHFNPALHGKELSVVVTASANSLYIDRYEIVYTEREKERYTVEFYTQIDSLVPSRTEKSVGQGIVLPDVQWQQGDWHFVGWTTTPIEETSECPSYFLPGATYYPSENTTLYALYSDYANELWYADTTCQSGNYLITWPVLQSSVCGGVNSDGEAPLCECALVEKPTDKGDSMYVHVSMDVYTDEVYQLYFLEDSTLTISHVLSNTPIGYKQTDLSAKTQSTWKYRTYMNHSIAFYTVINNNVYILRVTDNGENIELGKTYDFPNWPSNSMFLFRIPDEEPTYTYTAYPQRMLDIPEIDTNSLFHHPTDVRVGTSILRIEDHKKYLILQP